MTNRQGAPPDLEGRMNLCFIERLSSQLPQVDYQLPKNFQSRPGSARNLYKPYPLRVQHISQIPGTISMPTSQEPRTSHSTTHHGNRYVYSMPSANTGFRSPVPQVSHMTRGYNGAPTLTSKSSHQIRTHYNSPVINPSQTPGIRPKYTRASSQQGSYPLGYAEQSASPVIQFSHMTRGYNGALTLTSKSSHQIMRRPSFPVINPSQTSGFPPKYMKPSSQPESYLLGNNEQPTATIIEMDDENTFPTQWNGTSGLGTDIIAAALAEAESVEPTPVNQSLNSPKKKAMGYYYYIGDADKSPHKVEKDKRKKVTVREKESLKKHMKRFEAESRMLFHNRRSELKDDTTVLEFLKMVFNQYKNKKSMKDQTVKQKTLEMFEKYVEMNPPEGKKAE